MSASKSMKIRAKAAAFAFALGIIGATFVGLAQASHSAPDNDWGYRFTWYLLYPDKTGHISWKAYVNEDGGPVPLRDALILIDAVDNTWEAMLDYALAAGGYREFNIEGVAHDESAAVSYMRANTQPEVNYVCGPNPPGGIIVGCFAVASSTNYSTTDPDREAVLKAVLPYGPEVWDQPNNSYFSNHVAHEFGHGFGLAHHSSCTSVMGPFERENMPTASDIDTALDEVYGY